MYIRSKKKGERIKLSRVRYKYSFPSSKKEEWKK